MSAMITSVLELIVTTQHTEAASQALTTLSEDERLFRDSVYEFADREIRPLVREMDEHAKIDPALIAKLFDLGVMAIEIPDGYGGGGASFFHSVLAVEALSRVDPSIGVLVDVQNTLVINALLRWGSDEVKRRYLPKIASGEIRLQAFGVTEPDAGSDTTHIRTFARKDGDFYIVNGGKIFTSRVQHSDMMLLLARTTPYEQCEKKTLGMSIFLVDLRTAGDSLEVRPIDAMINHETNQLFFHDLKVPKENLIGEEGKGFYYILDGLNAERILVAAESIGDARWFIARAVKYGKERVIFGRPIAQNQGIQFPIAQAYAQTEAADLMRFRAADLFDASEPCGPEANLAKLLCSQAAWAAANAALDTHGGYGFAAEYDVERKFRECRLFSIAPISNNMVLNYVAEHVLGMPRSY